MRLSLLASACLLFVPLPGLAQFPPPIQIAFDPPVVSPGQPVTASFVLSDTCYDPTADTEIVARSASERLIRIVAHQGCDCVATPLPTGFAVPLGVLPTGAHNVELAIDRCDDPRVTDFVTRAQVVVTRLAPIVHFETVPQRLVASTPASLRFGTLCPAVAFGTPTFRAQNGAQIVTVPVTDSIADPCTSQPPGFLHDVPLPPMAVGRYGVEMKGPQGEIDNLGSFVVEAPGGDNLLLHAARFQVRASWRDKFGNSGTGVPVTLTSQTGYFWFFDAGNVELLVKVLNGCAINQRWWVFAAGLTDVEVILTVTDIRNGETRTYSNTVGQPFLPIQDTTAFIGCGSQLVID